MPGMASGSTVTSWPNGGSAGGAFNATAPAGSNTTRFYSPAAERPYVQFARSYLALQGGPIRWSFSGPGAGVTAVAVVKMPQRAQDFERIFDFSAPGCKNAITMYRPDTSNTCSFQTSNIDVYDSRGTTSLHDYAFDGSRFQVFTAVAGPTDVRLYKDGLLGSSATGYAARLDRNTSANYLGLSCWGAGVLPNEPWLSAHVYQLSIWRRVLSAEQLAQVHMELGRKWGIAVTLAPPPSPPKPPPPPRPPPPPKPNH